MEDEVEGEDFDDDDDDDLSEDRDDDDDDESEDEVIKHFCHSQYSRICLQKKQQDDGTKPKQEAAECKQS